MLLNADIIVDNLPTELRATMAGPKTMDLTLRRPELYEGGEAPLRAGHVYLMAADRVPQRALAERGCVIVSIGDSVRLERYRIRCTVIVLDKAADFYRTFNTLQHIFDKYDSWEADLRRLLDEGADISRMLTASEIVFENPLYAIDGNFRMLGASEMASVLQRQAPVNPEEGGHLSLAAVGRFLELQDLKMEEREPLVLTLLDQTTLNLNLLEGDEYRGCVTVQYTSRTYRPSDRPLIALLGKCLMSALKQLAADAPEGLGSLRAALQDLVEERPLSGLARSVIEAAGEGRRFACLRMKPAGRADAMPLGFVRNALEGAFRNSVVFEYHRNSVVAVIDVDAAAEGAVAWRTAVEEQLVPFTRGMDMKVGISHPFDNLMSSRDLFLQADRALDLGMLFDAEGGCYWFEDYALRSLVMNAAGTMDLDLQFPEGLQRLVAHDKTSETSYVETLRTYLANNLSVAKTAADLYVHRSTLMERLARIRRELDMDLDDADVQLRLRLLLRAMDLSAELTRG